MSPRGAAALTASAGVLVLAFGGDAQAGAWPMAKGATQAILKYERAEADEAFDAERTITPLFPRADEQLSLFVEHGLSDRLTLQAEAAYTRGEDAFQSYDGRGPVSLGLRWTALERRGAVLSVYVGATAAGEGRNAGYAPPGQGEGDLEVRLLAGRSGAWRGRPVFVEAQLARFERSELPDEVRLDTTLGVDLTPRWQLLLQGYAGQAGEGAGAPQWGKAEASLVRRLGPWSLQAGWRQSFAGRNSPLERGPVAAVWRRF